jgi:exodeoxyribonuclease-3
MRLLSYNINGLRAHWNDDLRAFLTASNADVIMFQETKATEPFDVTLKGYTAIWNVSARRVYAGTLCLFRSKPDRIVCGFNGLTLTTLCEAMQRS